MAPSAQLAVTLCMILQVFLVTSNGHECPKDSYLHDNSCYLLHFDKHFTFEDADAECRENNGFVSSFENTETRNFLRKLRFKQYYNEYWIGVNKVDNKWRYLSENVEVKFTSLLKESARKSDKCIAIGQKGNFRWQAMSCLYRLSFICQYEDTQCGKDDLVFGGKCYKLITKQKKFKDAKKFCMHQKGKLMEIENEEEQKFIEEAIKKDKSWTSITQKQLKNHDNGLIPKVWVGVTFDSRYNQWKTSDGSEYKSGKNKPSLPIPENENMKCACSKTWSIFSNPCNDSNSFICEYPVPAYKELQNENKYKIYPKLKMTYTEAVKFCENSGGTLPQANQDLEELKHFNIQLTESYWVQGDDDISMNDPSKKGAKCQANFIDNEGLLQKGICHKKRNYICQYSGESCVEKHHGDSCYQKTGIPATFEKAKAECETRGGKLAHISNKETMDKMLELLTRKRIPDFWVKNATNNEVHDTTQCQISSNSVLKTQDCEGLNHVICMSN